MAQPIWLDTTVVLRATTGGTRWRIRKGVSDVIFTGYAFPAPGDDMPEVRINDICASFLPAVFPLEGADTVGAGFYVDAWDGSDWQQQLYVVFCRDWSYGRDEVDTSAAGAFSAPVAKLVHKDGYLPVYSPGGSGSATLKLIPPGSGDFNGDYNQDFLNGVPTTVELAWTDASGDWKMLDLSDYEGLYEVDANGLVYQIANLCGGYVLYYLNALGGWDALPVTGRVIRSEDYARHTVETVYNNASVMARGKRDYVTEITPRYRLNVGPLSSDDAARIGQLTGSTLVYLHDIVAGEIRPVVLTGGAVEIKDRRGAMHTYEITAALAQNRIRR